MKPDVPRMLDVAAARLMARVAPALGPGYEQSSMMVLMAVLTMVREEFERAASRRVEENRELRRIFGEATGAIEDEALGARLAEAAAGDDPNLAISALEKTNADLRQLLIELHAHVEELDTAAAREIDAQIWRELAASTGRRALTMAPF